MWRGGGVNHHFKFHWQRCGIPYGDEFRGHGVRMCQKSVSARSQEKKGICFCVEKFEWYCEILSKQINREEYLRGKGFIVNLLSWNIYCVEFSESQLMRKIPQNYNNNFNDILRIVPFQLKSHKF